jgi:hypothetical protein
MARTTLKTLCPLSELLRTLIKGCLPRICLRRNFFIEPLPSNWNACYNKYTPMKSLLDHTDLPYQLLTSLLIRGIVIQFPKRYVL